MALKKWQEAAIRRELGMKRVKGTEAFELVLVSQFRVDVSYISAPKGMLENLRVRVNRQIDLRLEAVTQILESQSRDEFEAKRKVEHGSAHGK